MTNRAGPLPELYLTGWAHSTFGKHPDASLESLISGVAGQALSNAGLSSRDVDAVFLGNYNAGMVPLAFASSLVFESCDGLRGVASTRVENACASGSAAVHQAISAVLAGLARNALVIGAELMTHVPASQVGVSLLGADYDLAGRASETGFAGLFADVAIAYEDRYGSVGDTLGTIAAKSHLNAMRNPFAHLRKELSVDFCRQESAANPMVAWPLRRTDCSPVSDGAAALVVSSARSSNAATDAVRIIGFGHANDYLPSSKRDPLEFLGTEFAWARALQMADVDATDLSFVELHDCFTIAELNLYEVLGIAARGQGHRAIDEGWVLPDGRLPVNVSGGLKSKGHPVGATGVSQHVLSAMQLSGTALEMQLPNANRGAIHNMGGLAVANYVTVLEAF